MAKLRVDKIWAGHRYELAAVVNGAIIMVLEIVGARMIAPFFGTSIYVWTAVIGVILGALSFGYWYGGKLADRSASDRQLSMMLILAATVLLITLYLKDGILEEIASFNADLRLEALLSALMLFAPVNIVMGIVSPYLVKLKLTSLDRAGSSVGALYAAGTLGSIIGTFAAGYWLISWLGNRALGLWLVIGLVAASVVIFRRGNWWPRVVLVALTGLLLVVGAGGSGAMGTLVYDADTAYSRYQVVDMPEDRPRRLLLTDSRSAQSGIYLDDRSEPAFQYIQRFLDAADAGPSPAKILLIGGGAYTLPGLIHAKHPEARIDVVEIDPDLDEIAQRYFGYKPDGRVRVVNEDGRTFLNENREKYDLVFMDAFTAVTPPFQLTTAEAVRRLSSSLESDGAVVVNLISALHGHEAGFAEAEYATYGTVFEYVRIGATYPARSEADVQNLLLVAGPSGGMAAQIAAGLKLGERQMVKGRVLTDDHAPVEQLTAPH